MIPLVSIAWIYLNQKIPLEIQRKFIIEVPVDELSTWDAIKSVYFALRNLVLFKNSWLNQTSYTEFSGLLNRK